MIRWLLVSASCLFLLAGCGDSRRPTVQEQTTDVTDSDTPSPFAMPPGHGSDLSPGPVVRLGVVTLTAADTWVRSRQRNPIVIAEFSLPAAEGDSDNARLTVTAVGGTVELNVARWKEQFGGNPASESMKELEVSGVAMTLVDFSGTYGDSHMGPGSTIGSSGTRMKAAIFSAGGTQYIIKCTGPENTVGEHADEFLAFLKSLKPSGVPAATEEPPAEEPDTEEPATEEPATEC